jgi:cyclic dehypoxanthinyl futalosine synthase
MGTTPGITPQQALDCFASDDLIGIGMEADAIRRRLHPEGVVGYALEAEIDATLSLEAQLDSALEDGATGVTLRNTAGQTLESLERTIGAIRKRNLRVRALSASELAAFASLPEALARLRAAGLDTLLGSGVNTLGTARWIEIHRAAHRAGIPSTAEMVFGANESLQQRVEFLAAVRALQAETSGFLAFLLTTAPAPTGRELDDPTAVEYLQTLAIARMVLDNILHLQPNLAQQGLKVLQMALRFGGNDAGSPLASNAASEEELRRVIRDAGFKPVQRDPLHTTVFLA